jgi:S-adenosylmethionine synthetase
VRDVSIFCSEALTRGHPDKLCDQISDAIVDAFLTVDPDAGVLAECAVTKGILFIAAQVASDQAVDIPSVARQVIRETGYASTEFDADNCTVMTTLTQSPDRSPSTAEPDGFPARQFVTQFGFACRHSPGLMPLPVWLARRLARALDDARASGRIPYLSPDGQCQVAVELAGRAPRRVQGLTIANALVADAPEDGDRLAGDLLEHVIGPAFAGETFVPDEASGFFVNPQTLVRLGGPARHPGLTGRKTGADTYGEYARHSSSALSGKDPSRIDRIAAYAARHAARNVVAAGLAASCEVQLSYAIGQAAPVSIEIDTSGSAAGDEADILAALRRAMDFRPAAIVERYGLRKLPAARGGRFYRHLASYGQVGRDDLDCPWERDDLDLSG